MDLAKEILSLASISNRMKWNHHVSWVFLRPSKSWGILSISNLAFTFKSEV